MAELVAEEIRRRIVRGELVEGDSLASESELLEHYGVSRPTLREAFRVLEAEGLILIRRGSRGGARIQEPSVEVAARRAGLILQMRQTKLDDVHEVRALIEPPAAARLAERQDPEAIASLEELLREEEDAIDDPVAFAHASVQFHTQVVALAGNPVLALFWEMIEEILDRHTTERARGRVERNGDGLETAPVAHRAHEKLFKYVKSGQHKAAQEFWAKHLNAVLDHVRSDEGRTVLDLFD